jgi:hypothetical protein
LAGRYARNADFIRGLRAWRVHTVELRNRRDPVFSAQAVREENPYKGGSDWTEHRKSDGLIVAKKLGNASGAKGAGQC